MRRFLYASLAAFALALLAGISPRELNAQQPCLALERAIDTNSIESRIGPETRWVTALVQLQPSDPTAGLQPALKMLGALMTQNPLAVLGALADATGPRKRPWTLQWALPGRVHAASQQQAGVYYLFVDMKNGKAEGPFPAVADPAKP